MLILSALTLASCANVVIKDGEWCGDAGELGAMCFHTLSDESRDIAKPQWDEERFGMVCTKAENFAHWKATLLKLCRDSRLCTYKISNEISKFAMRVERFRNRRLSTEK